MPSVDSKEIALWFFRYRVASKGQANGLHHGAKLYVAIQANKRNVIDHISTGFCAIVMGVWYYLLNAELVVLRTAFRIKIAFKPILIIVSHSNASAVDTKVIIINRTELKKKKKT